jgi:hypothetical protein
MKQFASKSFAGKRFAAAALAAIGMGLATVPASAADTTCTTTLSNGTINGNLVVPNNASCTLTNETVTGSVTVGTGASLRVDGSTIGGNIRASHCNFVQLINTSGAVNVGGNVAIEFCTGKRNGYFRPDFSVSSPITISGNFTCSNNDTSRTDSIPCAAEFGSVGGNVQVNNNVVANVEVEFNTVQGNVQVNNNTPDFAFVEGNNIGGNLSCQGNAGVRDEGNPNTVAGHKLGQCAGL